MDLRIAEENHGSITAIVRDEPLVGFDGVTTGRVELPQCDLQIFRVIIPQQPRRLHQVIAERSDLAPIRTGMHGVVGRLQGMSSNERSKRSTRDETEAASQMPDL